MTEPETHHLETPEPEIRKRRGFVVVLLSLFLSGLGHLYLGEAGRGLFLFAGEMVLTVLFFASPLAFSLPGLLTFLAALLFYKALVVADSFLVNRKKGAFELRRYNRPLAYAGLIAAAMILSSAVEATFKRVEAFKIPSPSMVPTLIIGDHVMVDRWAYRNSGPRRGDVIVFPYPEDPDKDFIKRCAAVGGDVVTIRGRTLFIDGVPVQEPYAVFLGEGLFFLGRDNFGPYQVPEGEVFVLGDNRDNSSDSRFWGPVSSREITGKARMIYWSWDRETRSVRWDRIGKQLGGGEEK